MRLRSFLRGRIPERYRLLRYAAAARLRYYPEIAFSLGNKIVCPFCHWHFRRLKPAGFEYAVLREQQVIGAYRHPNDVCPVCFSNARERLVYLFLESKTPILRRATRLLHIAPEPMLARVLRTAPTIRYISGDVAATGVMAQLDVVRMPFPDEVFDAVVCNHVLEHVPDDRAAMAELYRILKRGGQAILQVPWARAAQDTVEDPAATSEADRIRLFGQRDHVRLYSLPDYVSRLSAAGFVVEVCDYPAELGWTTVRKYALIADERVVYCDKS